MAEGQILRDASGNLLRDGDGKLKLWKAAPIMSNWHDSSVFEQNPNTNYGDEWGIYFDGDPFDYQEGLIYPDDTGSGELRIHSSNDIDVELFKITEDWDESTVTWNNRPTKGVSIGTWSLGISTYNFLDLPGSDYGYYIVPDDTWGCTVASSESSMFYPSWVPD